MCFVVVVCVNVNGVSSQSVVTSTFAELQLIHPPFSVAGKKTKRVKLELPAILYASDTSSGIQWYTDKLDQRLIRWASSLQQLTVPQWNDRGYISQCVHESNQLCLLLLRCNATTTMTATADETDAIARKWFRAQRPFLTTPSQEQPRVQMASIDVIQQVVVVAVRPPRMCAVCLICVCDSYLGFLHCRSHYSRCVHECMYRSSLASVCYCTLSLSLSLLCACL